MDSIHTYGKKSVLTGKIFRSQELSDHSLEQSLLLHTVFESCTLINVNFENSDLEGSRFQDCKFIACSFIDTDIRSVEMTGCVFEKCDFERSHLTDLRIATTSFLECNFARASLTESTFSSSVLDASVINRTTFLHCSFANTIFKDMRIAECTFLYHIFENSEFNNVAINLDSLGYIYGIDNQQLAGLDLIFLSQTQSTPKENRAISLAEQFKENGWLFAASLLLLSTGQVIVLRGLEMMVEVFVAAAETRLGLKRDEIRFFGRLLSYLETKGHVPLLFIQEAGARVVAACDDPDVSPGDKDLLLELHSQLFLIGNRLAESFDDLISLLEPLGGKDSPIEVTVTHTQRPEVLFSELLHQSDYRFLGAPRIEGRLVREWEGSWNELLITTTATLAALVTSAALVNGLLRQLIQMRVLMDAMRQPLPRRESKALIASVIKASPSHISPILQLGRNMLKAGIQTEVPDLPVLSKKISQATKHIQSISVSPTENTLE